MEDFHRLLQLPAHCRNHRREDLYYARRTEPGSELHGADPPRNETYRCEYFSPHISQEDNKDMLPCTQLISMLIYIDS
jgi:hypothetical protein